MSPKVPVAGRRRTQAPPPWVVFEALVDPERDPWRPWLELLTDERRPRIVSAERPSRVVWSSLWPDRPEVLIEFALQPTPGGATDLRGTLFVEEPAPDEARVRHLRRRINLLVNGRLRATFDQ